MDKKLRARIEAKINTIDDMIKSISDDLDQVEDKALYPLLIERWWELRKAKTKLMNAIKGQS